MDKESKTTDFNNLFEIYMKNLSETREQSNELEQKLAELDREERVLSDTPTRQAAGHL